ncbi:hypothetical protein A2U01_0040219, partial [Trifolium medium]|nr:hypothetical protein [Trifolium medium]
IQASEPNLELLKNLICNDFRSLSDMKDEFMVFPTDISAEVAALKAKIGDALDKLERHYKKQIQGKAREDVRKLVESIERAGAKRLTLTPHFEPEEMMVLESVHKSLMEEMMNFEEMELSAEKKKCSEEENEEDSDRMLIDASDQIVADTSAKDKGKAIMDSEPPSYILKLQEDLDSQKVKHEALEVKVDNLAENQKVMATKQDTMDSKLDAILAL